MRKQDPRVCLHPGVFFSLLLAACTNPSELEEGEDSFYTGPTSIESLSIDCTADSDSWDVVVETAGWTAGGLMVWSPDGYYLEQHSLFSDEADFYGEWDVLAAELSITPDPRYVSNGNSTALLCDPPTREGLRGWLVVYDPETEEEADCTTWGAAFDWEAAGYSECTEDPMEL